MKKSLTETNPYLQKSALKKKMIKRFVVSSSAIENIYVTHHKKPAPFRKHPSISRKA